MDEVSDLLSDNRIKLVLIHRKRIYEIIECNITLLTFLNVIAEFIKCEIRDDRSGTSARKSIVLEFTEKACDSVFLVVLIDKIK